MEQLRRWPTAPQPAQPGAYLGDATAPDASSGAAAGASLSSLVQHTHKQTLGKKVRGSGLICARVATCGAFCVSSCASSRRQRPRAPFPSAQACPRQPCRKARTFWAKRCGRTPQNPMPLRHLSRDFVAGLQEKYRHLTSINLSNNGACATLPHSRPHQRLCLPSLNSNRAGGACEPGPAALPHLHRRVIQSDRRPCGLAGPAPAHRGQPEPQCHQLGWRGHLRPHVPSAPSVPCG